MKPKVCSVCKTKNDFVEFRFIAHHEKNKLLFENPCDFHSVFMCPNLHIIDEDGEEIKQFNGGKK